MDMALILQILIWLVSPGFILTIILLAYRSRPKRIDDKLMILYIDDESCQKVEQWRFEISWGHLRFCHKLELLEIPKTASYEITYVPIKGGLETPLPFDCHTEKTGKIGEVVYLINRGFFGREKVRYVFLLYKSSMSMDYRDRIIKKVYPTHLEIINENPIEIRNFSFQIPREIELSRLTEATQIISDFRIEIPSPYLKKIIRKSIGKCREAGGVATITLGHALSPKQGDTPGVLRIELS